MTDENKYVNLNENANIKKVNFTEFNEGDEFIKIPFESVPKFEEKTVDLVFVLDRSGSMSRSVQDTIGSFNSFIAKEKSKFRDTRVTTVLFDDEYHMLYSRKPISQVSKLTEREYFTYGCTALLDAIGTTITDLNTKVNNEVIFIVITDGYENASRRYNNKQIRNLISNHKWEFIFVGADIDSFSQSRKIGIDMAHTANFNKSSEGINDLFESFEKVVDSCHENKDFDISWKEGLE